MAEKEPKQKNRITINVSACLVEVESSTESLDKVVEVADDIAMKLTKGATGGKKIEKRIQDVGIR